MKKTWKKIVACFLAVVLLTLNVVGIHASSVDFLIRSDITSGGDEGYDEGYDECPAGGNHDLYAINGNSLPGVWCICCGQEGWMWQQWYECTKCKEIMDIMHCDYCGWKG